jgi:hypothetical protein
MKSPTVLLLLAASSALAQGTFQNLDFEESTVPQDSQTNVVSSLNAFPGWSVYVSTNQQTFVGFNNGCFGSTCVSLLGTNGDRILGYRSLEGGFSALLQGGVSGSVVLYPTAASILQTGFIPASARSILFRAGPSIPGTLSVSLGGIDIPFLALSNGPNYTVYGGDISAFAGQTALLEFSVSRLPGTASIDWNIDSIEFSASTIPEPSVLRLSALGTVLLAWRFLRQTRPDLNPSPSFDS